MITNCDDMCDDHPQTTIMERLCFVPSDLADRGADYEGAQPNLQNREHILTARQRELVLFVAEGLSNKEVARRANLSEGTVKVHLHKIYKKLGVSNRTALTVFAVRGASDVVDCIADSVRNDERAFAPVGVSHPHR